MTPTSTLAMAPEPKTAPYISFARFLKPLEQWRSTGAPQRIDRSVLTNFSNQEQTKLLAAYRFFDLLLRDGTPTPSMHELIASEGASRVERLRALYEQYPFAATLDLAMASPNQAKSELAKLGVSGTTCDLALFFMRDLAEAAGLEVGFNKNHRRQGSKAARGPRTVSVEGDDAPETPRLPPDQMTVRLDDGSCVTVTGIRVSMLTNTRYRKRLLALAEALAAFEVAEMDEAADEQQ